MIGEKDQIDSFRKAFLEIGDPTEYKFVKKYFGSWKLWEEFYKTNTDTVEQWHRELEAKIKSDALQRIFEASYAEGKECLAANKYLLEVPWSKEDKKNKVGRPSKEAIKQEAQRLVDIQEQVSKDFKRLFQEDNKEKEVKENF